MIKVFQIPSNEMEKMYPETPFMYGMGIGFNVKKHFSKYVHVANIATDDPNVAFEIGNIGSEDDIDRKARMHSVSVGDIFVKDNGDVMIVAPMGFDTIGAFEYDGEILSDEDPDAVYGEAV